MNWLDSTCVQNPMSRRGLSCIFRTSASEKGTVKTSLATEAFLTRRIVAANRGPRFAHIGARRVWHGRGEPESGIAKLGATFGRVRRAYSAPAVSTVPSTLAHIAIVKRVG
jgi:hypothetical protein